MLTFPISQFSLIINFWAYLEGAFDKKCLQPQVVKNNYSYDALKAGWRSGLEFESPTLKEKLSLAGFMNPVGLYCPLDGIPNPKYTLLHLLTTKFFEKRTRH